jgi:cation diffusion facilitator CzcD-associated flavoprotein CzcO
MPPVDDMTTENSHHEIAIVGAGFSGLGMAIELAGAGMRDFVVLERADDLGGTWRENAYPGCACDIPSVLYSWTKEQNPRWSRPFAGQQEIWNYMREVVARHDLERHLRFGHEVLEMRWDAEQSWWEIDTAKGTITADIVVSAAGALADPVIPRLPGLERFRGVAFHSARWDHDHDLRGREVAVVGTGASAIQFVPKIQPEVGRLRLFQRTPPWILPRLDPEIPEKWRRRFERHRRGNARMATARGLLIARVLPRLVHASASGAPQRTARAAADRPSGARSGSPWPAFRTSSCCSVRTRGWDIIPCC